jgi:hypothetical protein
MSGGAEERLLDLRFPARADRMALVRPSVRRAARLCGFDEDAIEDIVLAVGRRATSFWACSATGMESSCA